MKKAIFVTILTFIGIVSPVIASHGMAATYYVAATEASASDSNPGTLEAPWKTIAQATMTLTAGDTAYIRQGVYHEQLVTQRGGNATEGRIVFANYPGELPVIDGSGVTSGNNGVVVSHSYFKISGWFRSRPWDAT